MTTTTRPATQRLVTAGLFHSVDGVVGSPDRWQFDAFDDDLGQGMNAMIAATDTVLLGRVTYEEWASYWPTADAGDPFADFINPIRKVVASRTLTAPLAWDNAELIDGDLEAAVAALKEQPGGRIAVCGSISVVRALLFAGLLDELQLMTHPVVAGEGRRLFQAGDPVTRLHLVSSQETSAGNVLTTYRLRSVD